MPVAGTSEEGARRIFPCESCGADLEFSIGEQTLACPFCGHAKDLGGEEEGPQEQDLEAMLRRSVELHKLDEAESSAVRRIRCDACGAEVEFVGTLAGTRCPYCASPIQRKDAHRPGERIPADGVLPFRVEGREAKDRLRRWTSSRWFAPGDFKRGGRRADLEGVYLPFWTFDAMTSSRYRGQRGEDFWEGQGKSRRRKTSWTRVKGSFQRFFDDLLVRATRQLPSRFLDRLEPWPLKEARPFREELLHGYVSHTYDVGLEEGFAEARERAERALEAETRSRIGGDRQEIEDLRTQWQALTFKLLLLPVWLMAYRYGGKTYRVVVNATSGEVYGDRPWSLWKILGAAFVAFWMLVFFVWAFG